MREEYKNDVFRIFVDGLLIDIEINRLKTALVKVFLTCGIMRQLCIVTISVEWTSSGKPFPPLINNNNIIIIIQLGKCNWCII